MIFYASQAFSTEFANSFYNCYLFGSSIEKVVRTRISNFADITDFFTSFLFNLLSQSLSIRTIATNIQTFYTNNKWPEMSGELAKLLRICLDFDSSNAAGLNQAAKKTNKPYLKSVKQESILIDSVALKIMQATLSGLELTQTSTNTANPWLNL